MFDHIGLRVANLEVSKRFYAAALEPLGARVTYEDAATIGFGTDAATPFWLVRSDTPGAAHVAFSALERGAVDLFHKAALRAGGRDSGSPGLRPDYGPHYYAAFVVDPDGHNIEALTNAE